MKILPRSRRIARQAHQDQLRRLREARDKARGRVRVLDAKRKNLRASLNETTGLLGDVSVERDEWRARAEAMEQEILHRDGLVAEGRAVGFDYPYHPASRDFGHGDTHFFADLISGRDAAYAERAASLSELVAPMQSITIGEPDNEADPFWDNGWFPVLDAISLYSTVARDNPRIYMEVGSGNSTKFVRRAIEDHGLQTKLISIDPFPRAVVNDLCDEIIRTPFEDTDLAIIDRLDQGDVLFIDNSHRSFPASDVSVFFNEALPYLKPGVAWGVHDIFLPHDYPVEWMDRFYNEQYLLMTYLLGGARGDSIEFPVHYLQSRPDLIKPFLDVFPGGAPWGATPMYGGAFWMRKA